MAGHRSPRGRRAHSTASVPAWQLTGQRPPIAGPSLRTTIVATAAAVGAVATGTFTALLPTPQDGTASAAGASEDTLEAALAANTVDLQADNIAGYLAPVAYTADISSADDEHLALLDKAAVIAAELAELHAQQLREQEELTALIARGGVDGWIAEALQILELPQSLAPSVRRIIMAESGGNPNAINNWDANARRGTPSQGLMQTIPSTFAHYVHPSLADQPITDPVANITAGIRYMIDNYGMATLEAGGRSSSSGGYLGY